MLKRIRAVLEIIDKRIKSESQKETLVFPCEEFTKIPILRDDMGRALTFKEIEKDTKGNVLVSNYEIEKDPHSKMWTPSTIEIIVHIENFNEFNKYKKRIEQQLKTATDNFILILNDNGELYIDGEKESKNYPMELDALRHKIVHFLISQKDWIQTSDLANEFETSRPKIRKAIEQTKRMIEKLLKINGNKIIEGRKNLGGYRITKIKIREK